MSRIICLSFTLLFALCLPGCYDEQVGRLGAEVETLRKDNELLRKENQETLESMKTGIASIEGQKDAWHRFERNYSPDTRAELDRNLEACKKSLDAFATRVKEIQTLLDEMRTYHQEVARLKDQVVEHEKEARASNVVETLRKERGEMLEKARKAAQDASFASETVAECRRMSEEAERAAQSAKRSARESGETAARVDGFDRRIEDVRSAASDLEEDLLQLRQKISRIEGKLTDR